MPFRMKMNKVWYEDGSRGLVLGRSSSRLITTPPKKPINNQSTTNGIQHLQTAQSKTSTVGLRWMQSVLIIARPGESLFLCPRITFKTTRRSLDLNNARNHQCLLVRLGGEQRCTSWKDSRETACRSFKGSQHDFEILGCV